MLKQFAELFGPAALQPIAFAEQNWLAETWSRGCYAGIMGPGVMTEYGPALAANVGIHWAGTETPPSGWATYRRGPAIGRA